MQPVSRGHDKLKYALDHFSLSVSGKVCADFGSSTGGFVQALLEGDCKKVYSVETSKNRLHFVLKDDSRVLVLDKTNAVHVELPEKTDFISIDAGWTKQKLIIPNAVKNLKEGGVIVTLVKPHYEVGRTLAGSGKDEIEAVLAQVRLEVSSLVEIVSEVESPIVGKKGGNTEYLWLLRKRY